MKNDYNRIASVYDLICRLVFGSSIVDAQKAYLGRLPKEGKVLFIGGGSGLLLKELVLIRPLLEIDYIDSSAKMIRSSRSMLKNLRHKVEFIKGNENSIPSEKYDAIITFFYLDLFEFNYRKSVFKTLNQKLKNKGLWLISDFNKPRNWHQKFLEKLMFCFLEIMTGIESRGIENYQELFHGSSFDKLEETQYFSGFIFSSIYHKQVGTVIG